jgi:hypothetical protein
MSRLIVGIFGACAILCLGGTLVLAWLGKAIPEGLIAGAITSPLAALAGLAQPHVGEHGQSTTTTNNEEPKP